MRIRAWLLWGLFAAMLVAGAVRLRFDTEVLHLLPKGIEAVQGLELFQTHFSNPRELILVVEATAPEVAEASARALAQTLRAESNLVSWAAWQPGLIERPEEAAELIAFLWLNERPDVVDALAGRMAPSALGNTLEETRVRLSTSFSPSDLAMGGYDPYGLLSLPGLPSSAGATPGTEQASFASADGLCRLVFLQAYPELRDYRACRAWMADIQRVVSGAQRAGSIPDSVQLGYTGRPAFVAEISAGMENDMAGSSGGTLAVIGLLFWLAHRRIRPLAWLLLTLVMILAGTLALGGLCLGTLNVISLGFAAILLGLAEDFGIVIYQESRSHPEWNAAALRRRVGPGIFWSAVTTAGAFFALNLSALPGLGQLGTLVALGILLAAAGMLFGYLPPLLRLRRKTDCGACAAGGERMLLFQPLGMLPAGVSWWATVLLLVAAMGVLCTRGVGFDRSPEALEARNSSAQRTLNRVRGLLGQGSETLMVLVPGRDEAEVVSRLSRTEVALAAATSRHEIARFTLPTKLWPHPENQRANRGALAALAGRREQFRDKALEAGFNADALVLTENVLRCWEAATSDSEVFWPRGQSSRWLLDKVAARTERGFVAAGTIEPATNAVGAGRDWERALDGAGAVVSGWGLLGDTIFDVVLGELPRVLVVVFVVVVASLWLAFRSAREVMLSLGTIAFSAVLQGAVMSLLGWNWNLMNLMALPLLLGMGVDFSIHMQLALRDHAGDRLAVRRSTGRALLLAGATTVTGFVSLAFSTNNGMASLGRTSALGITLALLTAVYLLPVWWQSACRASWKMPNLEGAE